MKERILVENKYTVKAYRKILDEQSGIPGLPGVMLSRPDAVFVDSLKEARRRDPDARAVFKVVNSLTDGMLELVPAIVFPPVKAIGGK